MAFHAVVTDGKHEGLGDDQPIVFDRVRLNLGNGYRPTHGIFVAPMSGVYVFSTSVASRVIVSEEVVASIAKNGVSLAHIICEGDGQTQQQGSVTVAVQLDQDDEVSVDSRRANVSFWGNSFTSFTGFLLIPL